MIRPEPRCANAVQQGPKKPTPMPDAEYLRSVLIYNPAGHFIWKGALAAGALNVATDGMLRVRKQREDVLAALKALAALTAEPAAKAGDAEPVAVIGKDWQLLWASADTLKTIVDRTGVKIGSPLYAAPPSPQPDMGRDRVIMSSVRLGKWMSAALDDPNVCEEMKADIRDWFSAGEPVVGWAAALSSPASQSMEPAPEHRMRRAIDSLTSWLLHRFGPDSPEGQEAQTARAALSTLPQKEEATPAPVVCPSCDGTGVDLYDGAEHDCQICGGRGATPATTTEGGRG